MKLNKLIIALTNKQLIEEYNSLTISDKALNDYKKRVKNNDKESENLLIHKLKRNWLCGKFVRCSKGGVQTRSYGNLFIHCKGNEIVSIFNEKNNWSTDNIDIDHNKKELLDKYFGR